MKSLFRIFGSQPEKSTTEPLYEPIGDLTEREEKLIREFAEVIESSGYKSIQVAQLFKRLGHKRRGDSNTRRIRSILRENRIYLEAPPEVSSKRPLKDVPWKSTVKLYRFPVGKLGKLFQKEIDLEAFIAKHKSYRQLGIQSAKRQYSPPGTKDRLDFLGTIEKDKVYAVLELKHQGGGKSAVEQLLRYRAHLMDEYPGKEIRGILITGMRNLETAKAFYGLPQSDRPYFSWYLYKYDKARQTISFEEVSRAFIREHLGVK
jgi:hypothetical protein